MYAKLNNGVLSYAPTNYELDDKRIVVNFNKSEELMKDHGFKEVIDIRPEYDIKTQHLFVENYTEDDNSITINYGINDLPNDPTIEERISSIEDVILNLL